MINRDPAPLGVVEWFRIGDRRHVDQAIAGMKAAGVARLRTQLSGAEWHTPGGAEWYDWLLPRLGNDFDLLPCIHYTPPSLSRNGTSSGAPKRLRDYADFIDQMLTRYGRHFEAIELWNEPNNLLDWNWRQDPEHELFCEMIGDAAHWAGQRGMRTVLAGPSPFDPVWLDAMGRAGILNTVASIEAGLESLTEEGREQLAKRCRLDTSELAALLIKARRHVPFVQANLIGAVEDDPKLVDYWRKHLIENGVWANEPVPLYPYPSSPSYRTLWGMPDDEASERAHRHYLESFGAFSDIQDQKPLPLPALERACCG